MNKGWQWVMSNNYQQSRIPFCLVDFKINNHYLDKGQELNQPLRKNSCQQRFILVFIDDLEWLLMMN